MVHIMLRTICAFVCLILACLLVVSCSTGNGIPSTPGLAEGVNSFNRDADASHLLFGAWDLYLDPDLHAVDVLPLRDTDAHFNITQMVTPPACNDCLEFNVVGFDTQTRIMEVAVTLHNKFLVFGYDVRGILMTNDAGHLLTQPDNWTDLFDIPGGMDINPFMAFAKSALGRKFNPNDGYTEHYFVYIPVPPQYSAIRYCVEASWPGNCKEPYNIASFHQAGPLYSITGASVDLGLDVHDWQGDVDSVFMWAGDINGAKSTQFEYAFGEHWTAKLVNEKGAPAGEYQVRIGATSGTQGNNTLWDVVTITISDTTDPFIFEMDPNAALLGDNLTDVIIGGINFKAPAQLEIRKSTLPPIIPTNVVVVDPNTITCDIKIPDETDTGSYDVFLQNGDGKETTAESLFAIFCPAPPVYSVNPNIANKGDHLTGVEITGDNFFGPTVEVTLLRQPDIEIVGENVQIESLQKLTFDIDIPIDAETGKYNVQVVNDCGGTGVFIGAFSVL